MKDTPDSAKTGTRFLRRKGAMSRLVRRCSLRVVSGPDSGRELSLGKRNISIGSRPDCDFVLADPSVSGHHCEIELDDRGFTLRDLNSTNGTSIGPIRVGEVVLDTKTHITLGESLVEFVPLAEEDEEVLHAKDRLGDLLGQGPSMLELFGIIERVAPSDATVLISGETGTGKELLAESFHRFGKRASGPFVVVDCTAVPPTLFESELFGHERGAFTGAIASHRGAFERASGGTLFLDEISELDLSLQPKLLRVLESRRVQKLGSSSPTEVDVRVIAASRRELGEEVRRGNFRDDLYYRLAVVRVRLPALRERKEDIPLLASHFIGQSLGLPKEQNSDLSDYLSPTAVDRLLSHDWPGNVRELRNAIERALVLQTDPLPEPDAASKKLDIPADSLTQLPFQVAKKQAVDKFEFTYLKALLDEHEGNVSSCARAAGMDRRNFQRLLGRHNLGSAL